MSLCADNGAMIAAIAYHYLNDNKVDNLDFITTARVEGFKRSNLK